MRSRSPPSCACSIADPNVSSLQIRNAFADLNVEPVTSVLHGRMGLTPTVYVAPFLTPYANALGQARTAWHRVLDHGAPAFVTPCELAETISARRHLALCMRGLGHQRKRLVGQVQDLTEPDRSLSSVPVKGRKHTSSQLLIHAARMRAAIGAAHQRHLSVTP